jgi:glycosyltransferase involved in cell wall biosynthesis
MKIALNGMLLGGYFSGVEVTIRELAGNLQDYGTGETHFFVPGYAKYRKASNPDFHVSRAYLLRQSRIRRILWEHLILPVRVRQTGCQILHCPGYVSPIHSPVPVVLTIHDCFAWTHPHLCKTANVLHYRALLPRSAHKATLVIVPSEYVKQELIRTLRLDARKIRVIPFAPSAAFHAETSPEWQTVIRRKYNLPERYILFVGNIEPKKNIPNILRAFAQYATRTGADARLVLCGKETWGIDIRKEIGQSGHHSNIIRIGYVPLGDLPAVYSMADAFLFPSITEGFGIPVLEAMASGTPVVTSRNGALPETGGNAACYVDPENPDDIADTLVRLRETEGFRFECIQRGLLHAKRYSWRQTVEKTEAVYREASTTES